MHSKNYVGLHKNRSVKLLVLYPIDYLIKLQLLSILSCINVFH